MDEVAIGQVNAYVRYARSVDAEEYEVSFYGIFIMPDAFAMFVLVTRSAPKSGAENLVVYFLRKGGTVYAADGGAPVFVTYAIPVVYKAVEAKVTKLLWFFFDHFGKTFQQHFGFCIVDDFLHFGFYGTIVQC